MRADSVHGVSVTRSCAQGFPPAGKGGPAGLHSWCSLRIGATIPALGRWSDDLGSGRARPRPFQRRLRALLAIRDWILGEAREIGDPNIILEGVSLMMRDAG